MGLFDFMQRQGSVGSVVRWAHKNYHRINNENKDQQMSDILKYMFEIRYKSLPILSKEGKMRLNESKENLELENLMDLCEVIYYIELDLSPQDGKLFYNTFKNAKVVLSKLNFKHNTNYE